jgi:hypothetical protein
LGCLGVDCVVVTGGGAEAVLVDGGAVVTGAGVVPVDAVGVVEVDVVPASGATGELSLSTGTLRLSLVSVVELPASAASTTPVSGPPSPAAVSPPPASAESTARTARRRAGVIAGARVP